MATAITLDPVASALATIRTHFATVIPTLVIKRGIQELGIDQEADEPELSLIEITRDWEEVTPTVVNISGGPTADVLYKVAQLRITAQMDLWAPYRVLSDLFGPLVEAAFYNRLPFQGGLYLLSNFYFDRPLTISKAGAGINQRDAQDVAQGSWEKSYELEILTDLVVLVEIPITSLITIELSTQLGPDTVQEPDLLIPAP